MDQGVPVDDVSGRVADAVAAHFGLDPVSMTPVEFGADESAELWCAATADGSRWAVKLSGGGTPAGLVVSAYLAERGVPGIPAPSTTRDGALWAGYDGRRLTLVPWVSDRRALDGGMTAAHWRAYGELLAAVHAVPVGAKLSGLLPADDHTHRRVADAVWETGRQVSALDDSADEVTRGAAAAWRRVAELVVELLAEADRLGAELRPRPVVPVICHGDPHLGNVLLGDDGRVWLIDWDDALRAAAEWDLMFVTGAAPAFGPATSAEQAAFFAGYGPVDLDPVRVAYHLTVRALDDISSWTAQAMDPTDGDAERAFALRIVRGLLSPAGLVTLAVAALRDLGRPCARAAR